MSQLSKQAQPSHQEIDLGDVFRLVMEQKKFIMLGMAIFLTLGLFYLGMKAPVYQPDLLMQVEENKGEINQLLDSVSDKMLMGGVKNNVSMVQIALIQSRFILEPVIDSLGLSIQVHPEQSFFMKQLHPSTSQLQVALFRIPNNKIRHAFQVMIDQPNHLQLFDKKTLVLHGEVGSLLSNSDHSIQFLAKAVDAPVGTRFQLVKNAFPDTLRMIRRHLKIEDLGGRFYLGILSLSFKDQDPELAVSILNTIAKSTQMADIKKKSLEASKTLDFLYQQLPLAKQALMESESELNRYRAQSGKIDFRIQTKAMLAHLGNIEKKIADLNIKKIELLQRFTGKNPTVKALNLQLSAFQEEKNQLTSDLKLLPESDQKAVDLMRDVQVKSILYKVLLSKIQKLQVIKAGTVSDVRILAPAKIPEVPLSSNKSMIILASLILGFIVSALIVFIRNSVFPRVEDPYWIEKALDIPTLAVIPFSNKRKRSRDSSDVLLAQTNPQNLSIEALRSLRTSLQINLNLANNSIVSILGICPGVGKTFISTNLAYILAMANQRVLMIDADLRRGVAHQYFNVPATPGFSELLAGKTTVEVALKTTGHKNLTLLPRGAYPQDPSELLSDPKCKQLIDALAKDFDVVIIDTAPVLLVTDAVLLGALSATNYLVLGAKTHQTTEIDMTIKRLSAGGIEVHGAIFNFHHAASQRSHHHRYYTHYEDMAIKS